MPLILPVHTAYGHLQSLALTDGGFLQAPGDALHLRPTGPLRRLFAEPRALVLWLQPLAVAFQVLLRAGVLHAFVVLFHSEPRAHPERLEAPALYLEILFPLPSNQNDRAIGKNHI